MNGQNETIAQSEIVAVPNQTLAEATDDIIASAERRIANIQKIIELALKITTENDWVDQNGKPYLQASGAEKVARLFAVSWKDLKMDKIKSEDEKGQFYFYQVTGVFTLRHDSIVAVGTCSSKDQFFAKTKENGVTVLKPLSEVDETNIMKSAYSNCIGNGVTRILGLRNLTWEMVTKSGISKDKVASVRYASGGAGGGKISEPQAKRLMAILLTSAKDQKERDARMAKLKGYLMEFYQLESHMDINRKDYETICTVAETVSKGGEYK